MCGIAGVVALPGAPPATERQVRAMCDTLVHRGPDDEGIETLGPVALGMRRLSIIDVSGGRQPLYNEDRTVRMVFNGEIYNFRELRRELEGRGHRFSTHADGEVVVHLWEEVGTDFAPRLNGMYSIALHDSRRGRFVLARDRLGVKPLFYALQAGHLVFGSEIQALLASGLVERRLDVDGLAQFLSWEYVPAPGTLFAEVRKLEPARLLELDLGTGRHRFETYWDVPLPDRESGPRTDEEWLDAVDAKIGECVRRQLVSDVPLGAFLSGGVDSSLVVAGMGPDANTFSIGFADPSYSELRWSGIVAKHLGVRHRTETIEPTVVDLFDRLMGHLDDPIGDFSIFPTFLVSRLARRDVKVALSGDGGDECFGGYETYSAQRMSRALGPIPLFLARKLLSPVLRLIPPRPEKKGAVNKVKRFVEGLDHEPGLAHARWRLFLGDQGRDDLFTPDARAAIRTPLGEHVVRLFAEAGPRPAVDRGLYVDLKSYLVDNCLVKVDRMSMATSLEARVPLLDHELVELAFGVPPRLKVASGRTKVLLKRVAARHVPPEAVYRPKEGFSIPIKHWLGTQFRPLLEDLLSPSRLRSGGVIRPEAVERLKEEHLAGRANHSHVLWSLMVFEDWRRRWGA